MRNLFYIIAICVAFIGCNSNNNTYTHKIFDEDTNEFYVYDIPVSKGAANFMKALVDDDCWKITYLVNEDDWWSNPYLKYEKVHWCRFSLKDSLDYNTYLTVNRKCWGNLTVLDSIESICKWIKSPDETFNYLLNTFSIVISWYQSGQICEISIENYELEEFVKLNNACDSPLLHGINTPYNERHSLWDSIFPEKRVANSMFGFFQHFGGKNVSVYCTDNSDVYKFDEVFNEKYQYNVQDILTLFEYDTITETLTGSVIDTIVNFL